jgi:hypothetical protein
MAIATDVANRPAHGQRHLLGCRPPLRATMRDSPIASCAVWDTLNEDLGISFPPMTAVQLGSG